MISRKIYIIKGYSKDYTEVLADYEYLDRYSEFFQSNAGGAYSNDELIVLDEPESNDLKIILDGAEVDYGIVVYIGHGANQNDNQLFQINQHEIIKPGHLILNAQKQIIILESCRVVIDDIQTVDLSDKIPKFEQGGVVRLPLSKDQSREIYDSHIKRCKPGIMVWYACQLGNEAYNYIFSRTLLQTAMKWHLDATRHCAFLPVDELSRLTFVETICAVRNEIGGLQIPCSEGNMNYPFAVSKF